MRVTRDALTNAQWRKSSYSNAAGGDCLETAAQIPGTIPVRDSKCPARPALLFTAAAWTAFLEGVKAPATPRP
ncbi:MAG: DUF397 domain-containing protein [Streptomyces sp.]|uniref:DUF397 domain-containing protein n=1 Tax=Streptomyces sp. TaxID=1931 RepID=UPI003D6BD787